MEIIFRVNGVWGGSRQKGRLPGDPSETPHLVNKDRLFSVRAAENNRQRLNCEVLGLFVETKSC